MIEMFESIGFRIVEGKPRVFEQPTIEVLEAVKMMAIAIGADPDQAANDAIPLQYVIRAVPV